LSKVKLFAVVAIALLIASLAVNGYQYIQFQTVSNQKSATETKLQMNRILADVQTQVNLQLETLGSQVAAACRQLSTINLSGSEARLVLLALAQNNSLVVNACTCNATDVILAVEPSQYSHIEGEDISGQEQNLMMHETLQPVMSNMIYLVEGFYGVVLVAPIFDSAGTFVGSLSVVIQPYDLLASAIDSGVAGTEFAMWAMQVNGTLLYDPDPMQQGKNLFTDPLYTEYPTVQAFTHQVGDAESGYGTYTYHQDTTEGQLVNKEAYWTSASLYGTQWRIVILNVLPN
jgi:hypothetical protein